MPAAAGLMMSGIDRSMSTGGMLVLAMLTAATPAMGQPASGQALPFTHEARAAVSDTRLSDLRGGFASADGGLLLSIGVQRQVTADGSTVPVSTFQFCSPSCSAVAASSGGTLLQRGAGNSVPASMFGGSSVGAVVIQNSLDQQQLKALTNLDVTANSLQMLKGSAWQSAVGGAIAASTRR